MNQLDLRPLSLGEILDRTFTLYRRHFVLFIGLVGIPQLISLAFGLVQISFGASALSPIYWLLVLLSAIATGIAYLLAQGACVLTVADLYTGRSTSVAKSLSDVWSEIGALFGVVLLNGLVIGVGFILLVIPGIYLVCRLLVCVPAALLENRGPRDSLSRSWELTKGFAGRSFVIVLLSVVLSYAIVAVIAIPLGLNVVANGGVPPGASVLIATRLLAAFAAVLIQPITLIATAIFYYDLRVRKEAFDLQLMMDPDDLHVPGANFGSIMPE